MLFFRRLGKKIPKHLYIFVTYKELLKGDDFMVDKTINTNISDVKGSDEQIAGIKFHHVDGEQKGFVELFALSTCGWCKQTRMFLELNEVAYDYIYVDLTSGEERDAVMEELEKYNPDMSFPTLVIDHNGVITGYEPEEMAAALDIPDYEE